MVERLTSIGSVEIFFVLKICCFYLNKNVNLVSKNKKFQDLTSITFSRGARSNNSNLTMPKMSLGIETNNFEYKSTISTSTSLNFQAFPFGITKLRQ